MTPTFGRKLLAALTAALLALAVVAVVAVRSARTLSIGSDWVSHTQQTLSEISDATSIIQEAENAMFGYLVTGDRTQLVPVGTASWKFSQRIHNLNQLLKSDDRQRGRLRALEELGWKRLAEVRRVLADSRVRPRSGTVVIGRQAQQQAKAMGAIAGAMRHSERQKLQQRSLDWSKRVNAAGLCFALLTALDLLLLLALWRLHRSEAAQRANALKAAGRLGSFVTSSKDAIFDIAPDGAITSWNSGAETLFGYEEAEVLGQSVRVLSPPDTVNEDVVALGRLAMDGEAEAYEAVRVSRDGRKLDVHLTVSPLRDADGLFLGASVVARDMRSHREAERALRESQARFRVATDAMEEGLTLQDAGGVIRLYNRRAAEILGLGNEQTAGKAVVDLRWRFVRQDGAALLPDEHPSAVALRTGRAVHDEIIGLRHQDDRLTWLSVNAVHIFDGREAGVVSTFTDITEQREWRTVLEVGEQRFRSAIDHAPIGIGLMQPNGRWYRLNEAFCRMLGRTCEDLMATPFRRLLWRGDRRVLFSMHRRLVAGEIETYQLEQRYLHASGDPLWLLVNVSVVRDAAGAPRDYIVQAQDVTERRRRDEDTAQHVLMLNEARAELEMREQELRHANERLETLATLDGLTGLKNYRCFRERLPDEFLRARRYNHPLSLVLMDVDRFKNFNDTHGHLAGDAALASVARLLEEAVRETDLVARYGGEEFVMVLPHTTGADAWAIAERIRRSIEATGSGGEGITASFGVASATVSTADGDDLIAAADSALYTSKSSGRNCVTLFGQQAASSRA